MKNLLPDGKNKEVWEILETK